MVEIRSGNKYTLEDFLAEFNGHNFVDGLRVVPYKQFIKEQERKESDNNEE